MRKMKSQCRECHARGYIRVQPEGDQARIIDEIRHRPSCSKYRARRVTQPAHLRKKRWVAQERRAAKLVGGYETLMSGAANNDADARKMREWRCECKRTKWNRFPVHQEVWTKLVQGARENGEVPVLNVILGAGSWRETEVYLMAATEADPFSELLPGATLDLSLMQDQVGHRLNLEPPAKILTPRQFQELVEHERNSTEMSEVH